MQSLGRTWTQPCAAGAAAARATTPLMRRGVTARRCKQAGAARIKEDGPLLALTCCMLGCRRRCTGGGMRRLASCNLMVMT